MKNHRSLASPRKGLRGTASKEQAKNHHRASSLSGIQRPSSSDLTISAASNEKRLNSDQILHLQRAVGNRAVAKYLKGRITGVDGVSAIVQAKGKGQILLSYQQMQDVYASYINTISASRGYPSSKAGMTQVHADALVRMAKQIGSGNFERYMEMGGGKFTYIPPKKIAEEADQIEAEEAAAKEQKSQDPMGDLYSAMRKRARSLNASATRLKSAVVQAEYFTHMLKSPEGAKGVAYQIAAGTLGTYAAVKHGADYAKKTVEDKTKDVLDPIGQAIDKGVDKAVGKKEEPKPTFEDKAEEFGQTVGTSYELMTGQLHELYQQTRPSYGAFQQAKDAFYNAHSAYWRVNDLETLSEQLGHMINHLKAMKAAANQYLMACEMLGIRRKAAQYIALDKAVVESIKSSVTSAVDLLGKEMIPDLGVADKIADKAAGKLPKAVGDTARETVRVVVKAGAKQGTDVVSGAPKKVAEAAAQQ